MSWWMGVWLGLTTGVLGGWGVDDGVWCVFMCNGLCLVHAAVKIECAVLVLICALYVQNLYRPMVSPEINRMESVTLLFDATALVAGLGVFVGTAAGADALSEDAAWFLYTVYSAFMVGCAGVLAWIVWYIILHKRTLSGKARAGPDAVGASEDEPELRIIDTGTGHEQLRPLETLTTLSAKESAE